MTTEIRTRMKTSRITTKGDTIIDECFHENNNRRFHATWIQKLHEMLPILLGTSMRNKRERDEIEYVIGYIANSPGQTGNINCNMTFDSFRWGIVAICSFSNLRHFKLFPYNKMHSKMMTLQLSVRLHVRPFTPMQRMQLPLAIILKPHS